MVWSATNHPARFHCQLDYWRLTSRHGDYFRLAKTLKVHRLCISITLCRRTSFTLPSDNLVSWSHFPNWLKGAICHPNRGFRRVAQSPLVGDPLLFGLGERAAKIDVSGSGFDNQFVFIVEVTNHAIAITDRMRDGAPAKGFLVGVQLAEYLGLGEHAIPSRRQ